MIHTIVEPPADFFYEEESINPSAGGSITPVPPALEKTRMCVYYLQGRCKYEDCSFAHSTQELKQAPSNLRKTKMCDLFMMGHCYDAQCNFAHSVDELKVRPKRSMSTCVSPTVSSPEGFDKDTYVQNTEFCARTILSMLIRMQPEAAVAFLSNPECKLMMERLLEDRPQAGSNFEEEYHTGVFATPSGSSTSVGSLSPQQTTFDSSAVPANYFDFSSY
jgi:hypothetical protein